MLCVERSARHTLDSFQHKFFGYLDLSMLDESQTMWKDFTFFKCEFLFFSSSEYCNGNKRSFGS